MLEQEFTPYEQALALKELGFDEPCFGFYEHTKKLNIKITKDSLCNKVKGLFCDAPTFSQAFRWFRENYNLTYHIVEKQKDLGKFYGGGIIESGQNYGKSFGSNFKTYEEAELECLKKLIEIVKKDKL